jgi:hypothetical protein
VNMSATETYVGRHRLTALAPRSSRGGGGSSTAPSSVVSISTGNSSAQEQRQKDKVSRPSPLHQPTTEATRKDPLASLRETSRQYSQRTDNSSEYSDDLSAGEVHLPTPSPAKPAAPQEDMASVRSSMDTAPSHKPTLHSKSSRSLLLPPPKEIGTLRLPVKSSAATALNRGMSRAGQLNQLSRQQSCAAAAAEAETNPYKSNVGSAGFRMSNKSFRIKKLHSGVGSPEDSDEDESDFFSPAKQKAFDRSELNSVVSELSANTRQTATSRFKKGGVVVPDQGREFRSSSAGVPSAMRRAK